MRRFRLISRLTALVLLTISVKTLQGQAVQFSSDMRLFNGPGDTQVVKLYVGNKRALIQRDESKGDVRGIGSIVMDFENQFVFLLIPQSRLYLRVTGSQGSPFYNAAWMFRPYNPATPCAGWVAEADRRGITLRCKPAGGESLNGSAVQRWDAAATNGSSGSLWYDPDLNFVVKVLRKSAKGVESGYELQNVKKGNQPPALFDTADYREFTMPKLLDVLTGAGQW
jgi:hypothetical protein